MGKGLESFLSPAVSAGYSPLNRYALLIPNKLKKYTKQEERNARPRPDSMAETTRAGLGQSVSQPFFAIYAEKERKKMTLLKLTTSYLPAPDKQPNSYQLTEVVIDAEATSP